MFESKAPHGMVLNPEVKTVVLEYADENTPVVFEDTGYVNDRQKVDLSIIKKDTENNVLLKDTELIQSQSRYTKCKWYCNCRKRVQCYLM